MPGEEIIEAAREIGTYAAEDPGLLSEIGSAVYNALSSVPGKMALTLGGAYAVLEVGTCLSLAGEDDVTEDLVPEDKKGIPRTEERKEEVLREDRFITLDDDYSAYGPFSSFALSRKAEE